MRKNVLKMIFKKRLQFYLNCSYKIVRQRELKAKVDLSSKVDNLIRQMVLMSRVILLEILEHQRHLTSVSGNDIYDVSGQPDISTPAHQCRAELLCQLNTSRHFSTELSSLPALTKVHEVYGKLAKMKECYWIFPTFSSNAHPINQHSEAHSNLGNFFYFLTNI